MILPGHGVTDVGKSSFSVIASGVLRPLSSGFLEVKEQEIITSWGISFDFTQKLFQIDAKIKFPRKSTRHEIKHFPFSYPVGFSMLHV